MSKHRTHKPMKHSQLDIALLTAGYVEPEVFKKCVDAIQEERQGINSEFYVVRNGRVPETQKAYDEILATVPDLHVKLQHENLGFPRGANLAIKAGTSPLILFISDDIILSKGSIINLIEHMKDPTIGLCGLKLIFPPESTDPGRPAGRVQHIGHAIDINGNITHPLLGWKPDNPKCCVTRELQSVTGAAFMVRRNVFLRAGGFFEGYGMGYFEDVDLNLTIRTIPNGLGSNYRVFVCADAQATHYTGATFIKRQQPTNMEVNRMILLQRKSKLMVNDSFSFW